MKIEIRLSKDAALLARMNRAVQDLHYGLHPEYFKPYSYDEAFAFLSRQLEEENWFCYVAAVDGADAGYALFFVREYCENPFRKGYRGIHVDQISIEPKYKGRGIGKALMSEIEAFARKEKAEQLELTHWELNEEAKGFYGHLGFATNFRFVAKRLD
jgi:diamine N-acetyltransferase